MNILSKLCLSLFAAATLCTGCNAPATASGMALDERGLSKLNTEHDKLQAIPPVRVREVRGGAEPNLSTPDVSSTEFRLALDASLLSAGLKGVAGVYQLDLDAELIELEIPPGADEVPAYLTVRYQAYSSTDGRCVFVRTIRTGCAISDSTSFTTYERMRLAVEGAARENITQLILELGRAFTDSDG